MANIFKKSLIGTAILCFSISGSAWAASQDQYDMPAPYLELEQAYLKAFPDLQEVMDAMVDRSAEQVDNPDQNILHNRLCAALVYEMALDQGMSTEEQRQAIAGDLLHNIAKEEADAVLSNAEYMDTARDMVAELQQSGYFEASPQFWDNEKTLLTPDIADNKALIHHITGAVLADKMLADIGGFTDKERDNIKAAITEHSTGYWYFRATVDEAAGESDAWKTVYPEPESDIAKLVHDADLISQFVPESVVPDGAKWRTLAKDRWGATNTKEEGHIVYYVFLRLFEEAKTPAGIELAKERWDQIAPELIKLMGLEADQDPIEEYGVPKVFQ